MYTMEANEYTTAIIWRKKSGVGEIGKKGEEEPLCFYIYIVKIQRMFSYVSALLKWPQCPGQTGVKNYRASQVGGM